jgi:hypothetical protein
VLAFAVLRRKDELNFCRKRVTGGMICILYSGQKKNFSILTGGNSINNCVNK